MPITYKKHPGTDHALTVTKVVPHIGAGAPPDAPGEGAFESFAHADTVVRHLATHSALADRSPGSLRYWKPLTEGTHEEHVELARRARVLLANNAWGGDERIQTVKRWLAEYEAEPTAPEPPAAA